MFPRLGGFFRFCPLFAVYGIPAFTTVLFEMIKGCVGVGEEGGVVFTVPGIETDAHTDRDAVAIAPCHRAIIPHEVALGIGR